MLKTTLITSADKEFVRNKEPCFVACNNQVNDIRIGLSTLAMSSEKNVLI